MQADLIKIKIQASEHSENDAKVNGCILCIYCFL